MAVQDTINTLLGEYVALGDSEKLTRLLTNEFKPDGVDLITQAAAIGDTGDGRDAVLTALITNGVE